LKKTWEKNKREKKINKVFFTPQKSFPGTQGEVNFFSAQEAQAESESLFPPNAHTQLNSRHGRDQHSEAACTSSGNFVQINKKSKPHSALSLP